MLPKNVKNSPYLNEIYGMGELWASQTSK